MPIYKLSGEVPYVHESWCTYGTPPGEYIVHLVTNIMASHCQVLPTPESGTTAAL